VQNLKQIKSEGLDPKVKDVAYQRQTQSKFVSKQGVCDKKMKELY